MNDKRGIEDLSRTTSIGSVEKFKTDFKDMLDAENVDLTDTN